MSNDHDHRVRIAPASWDCLQAITRQQADNARCLGVARWEYLKAVAALGAAPDFFKLGQARCEYRRHEDFLMAAIAREERHQQAVGEAAMRAVGIDPDSGEFTIDQGGVVLQLLAGSWRPVMAAASSVRGEPPHRHLH